MLSINTNISSLIAQESMKSSTNKLDQAIERMTTGFKINHAKDNAANYSISTNMTTQLSAYQVAEDNTRMGLDMVSNAEDTLSLIQDKLQRLRALEEQSNNGTYGEQSKLAINSEANSLVDEINRLYSTAEYNGKKLFSAEKPKLCNPVTKRDTTGMDKMADVDKDQILASGTYSISTAEDLEKLAYLANNGKMVDLADMDPANISVYGTYEFVLANDIDLSGINWTSIGGGQANIDLNGDSIVDENDIGAFSGIFDGNGYTISNMTQRLGGTEDVPIVVGGFIGIAVDIEVKNLALDNINIEGGFVQACGGLVGMAMGGFNINNLSLSGKINSTGTAYSGGLAAMVDDSTGKGINIKDCIIEMDISEAMYTSCLSGYGLFSTSSLNIENIYIKGNIKGTYFATGLGCVAGSAIGTTIKNVTIDANIDSTHSFGFVYAIESPSCEISDCYVTGNIKSNEDLTGFIYNAENTKLSNCYMDASLVTTDPNAKKAIWGKDFNNCVLENCEYNADKNPGVDLYDASNGTPTLNNVTPIDTSKPLDLTGVGFKYNDPKANAGISIEFQVGINDDSSSQIKFNSSFELDGVNNLRYIGKDSISRLGMIDNMLKEISAKQTEYGAVSNRLMSVLDEISIQYENLASSRSTIRDADIAEVSSQYIQQQILQQASATLMATANQNPAIALQLI